MNRTPADYAEALPGHLCTRLRMLRLHPQNNQKAAVLFVDYVLSQLPFTVQTIQTDNGDLHLLPCWHRQ